MILQNGRPAGLNPAEDNKGVRGWPHTLQRKAKSQHEHVEVSLESKCACPFLTYVAADIHFLYHSKTPLTRTLLRSNTQVEKTEGCTAEAMYTEYQSTAPALEHEWWFSRSTFRWEEKEVSAGWFSASISYKRGHFSPHRMTYEGTAAAFISILLWGMVAKVSLYLL